MDTLYTKRFRFLLFLGTAIFLGGQLGINAQSYSAKVIDQKTGTPIPFATIQLGKYSGIITNEDGVFNITNSAAARVTDSVSISSMGYDTMNFWLPSQRDSVIVLTPATFALKTVFLTNNPLSPEQIIDKVKENISNNYADAGLTNKRIFFRQSDRNKMIQADINFKKSTIEELNKGLIDSIADMIPRSSDYYRETVGQFYGNYAKHKLHVEKAAELYDKSKDISVDGLAEKMERIFKENVKPNSYLKIKSGLFGTKVQLDSVLAENEEAKEKMVEIENTDNQKFGAEVKGRISELYEQLFFHEDSKIDVLDKSNRYRFSMEDYTVIDDTPVYIINFVPKGKKDFKGVMYVNTEDFAIVRLEFENVRKLSSFGLLGISYARTVYRGKSIFAKDANGTYSPRYLELEEGSTFGIDRPLKVIEKNKFVKGRRKQNELSLGIDMKGSQFMKYELVVFESKEINQGEYETVVENETIKPVYLSKYDPSFWDGYAIMEPNAAIQAFEVQE
ncbi:MAG: hypothetical protein ACI828_001150 [Flavobacteriales bacterium]|jgi:hypothetical protein